eukprot:9468670-Pyramimonas_sp.AAC.1
MGDAACDDAIWQHMKETDPLLHDHADKASIVKINRGILDASLMSETVTAPFPAVECTRGGQYLKHDAIALTFLFELKACKNVSIECVPAVMEHVRVAAVAAVIDTHDREKRARSTSGVTG